VVGSGIAGLSTALSRQGKDVMVIDRGQIGMGMTSRTTAHLSAISDHSFDSFIKLRGLALAKTYYQSQLAAVDRVEQIQSGESIDCHFRRLDGFLFPAVGSDPGELAAELDAVRRVGVAAAESQGVPFTGQEEVRCLRYSNQGALTGEADDAAVRFEGLESWIRGLVPTLGRATHRWSGQILEPLDYSGFIGRNPGSKNVYVATGDSGQGITHGVVASLLLSDLIMKGASPWQDLYEPSRKPLSAVQNFIAENATAVKNFAEYITPGELSSIEELTRGQGAIIREGLSKIAAYRDDNGVLYRCSAACTHAGCHVHWNSLEICWDCPCHGSHFAVDGTVLNAPAISALAPK
jgi:glycine/D-amino acid oxidase-like deaminating enzyme/nitrite reductase/ring-hydroxylating ferredoxin subunit